MKELFIRFTVHVIRERAFVKFCVCPSFPFGFEGRMWDVCVLIPDHSPSLFLYIAPLSNPISKQVNKAFLDFNVAPLSNIISKQANKALLIVMSELSFFFFSCNKAIFYAKLAEISPV